MAGPNLFQIRRTSVADREANTITLPNVGEVGVNLTDGRMWVANSTSVFEIGANTKNCRVSNSFFIGDGSVNTSANSTHIETDTAQLDTAVYVGANVDLTTAGLIVGNTTVNLVANSISVKLANSTVTFSLIKPTAAQVSSADYYFASDGAWKQVAGGPGGSSTRVYEAFTATASQTTFTVTGGYDVGYTDIYVNGVKLAADEYTEDGTDIVLDVGALVGSIVEVVGYKDLIIEGVVAEPAGANTQVQFNDSGLMGGVAGFTFDKDTNNAVLANTLTIGTATINSSNYSQTANNALYLGGTLAADYQTEAGLSANVATLTANNSLYLGGTLAADYQTEAGLSANVAILTANNTLYLGGVLAADYQTEAGLAANVAILDANTAKFLVGANVVSNTTGLYPLSNTSGAVLGNTISRFILTGNSSTLSGGLTSATVNATTSVNSALVTVGTDFIANTLGAYHTGTMNAVSFTTTGFLANVTHVVPTSNSSGQNFGNTISRWIITANSAALSTSLTADTVNAVTSVNSALVTVGTAFVANTLGAYHTGIMNAAVFTTTGFRANATHVVPTSNSSGQTFGNTLSRWIITANSAALSTSLDADTVNAVTSVNSALIKVGSSFVANTLGAYHTGLMNAASFNVGTSTIVNSSVVSVTAGSLLSANIQTNPQTGTTYTLAATDSGKLVTCNNASSITVTVPAGLPIGFRTMVMQVNTGVVTLSNTGQTGASIFSRTGAFAITAKWGTASVSEFAANAYVIDGSV